MSAEIQELLRCWSRSARKRKRDGGRGVNYHGNEELAVESKSSGITAMKHFAFKTLFKCLNRRYYVNWRKTGRQVFYSCLKMSTLVDFVFVREWGMEANIWDMSWFLRSWKRIIDRLDDKCCENRQYDWHY